MPRLPRSLTLLLVALLGPTLACHDSDPPCEEIASLSECEADSRCDAQVAHLIINGFAGPLLACDHEQFVQCHDRPPAGSPPPAPHVAMPPAMPLECWATLSPLDLPADWIPCVGLDPLADDCP